MVYEKRIISTEKIKFLNKWHFVVNKTDCAACRKNAVNFLFYINM